MNDTSAQFHILNQLMTYRDEAGLIGKDPTNDHSSTIRLPSLIPHLEMLLSLSNKLNLIVEKQKGTLNDDWSRLGELYHNKATRLVYPASPTHLIK